tara:strand:- start:1314 stop:1589 length:276 start_codon:yes stop_codon:yes gene_type:complete
MLISPDEIQKSISMYNWKYTNNKIHKSYSFKTYIEGVDFINRIVEIAERNNHHPDIFLTWCKVEISITSHDLGGVTTKCINLAASIDNIIN